MNPEQTHEQRSPVGRLIRFCLENRLVVVLFTLAVIFAGVLVAPFDWKVGELQRYFRDKGWAIKVPRRLQELSFKVNQSMDVLTQKLQRSPTIQEIAEYLEVTPEEVLEAMETSEAYNFVSLEGDRGGDGSDSFSILEYIGKDDQRYCQYDAADQQAAK